MLKHTGINFRFAVVIRFCINFVYHTIVMTKISICSASGAPEVEDTLKRLLPLEDADDGSDSEEEEPPLHRLRIEQFIDDEAGVY